MTRALAPLIAVVVALTACVLASGLWVLLIPSGVGVVAVGLAYWGLK